MLTLIFGHGNIIKYAKRPFLNEEEQHLLETGAKFRVSRESIEKMDKTIIDNINAVVKADDVLRILGDFAPFANYELARRYRDRINCRNVYLFWGNHDSSKIKDLFEDCYVSGGGGRGHDVPTPLSVEGHQFWCNHYPHLSWEHSYSGVIDLYGHVHGTLRRNPLVRAVVDAMNILDVGVDGPDVDYCEGLWDHKLKPWSVPEIVNFLEPRQLLFKGNRTV